MTGISIIPKDENTMKEFVGKTREWIQGFLDGVEWSKEEVEEWWFDEFNKREDKSFSYKLLMNKLNVKRPARKSLARNSLRN